jgi:8-oxo-dGTP pyrophosphatase MutT (NUDIX family)
MTPETIWTRLEAVAQRAPVSLIPPIPGLVLKPAGVLIPAYRRDLRPHLLFTRRSRELSTHSGEISFPGGGQESSDLDERAAALRETHEELGIVPSTVRVIGPFDQVISIAGYRVATYLAEIPPPPVPAINHSEVEEVIEVDLVRILADEQHRSEVVDRFGFRYELHFYQYDEHVIWGMTGGLLYRLLCWLKESP